MTRTEPTHRGGCPDPALLHTMHLAAPMPLPDHVDDCSRCRTRWYEATTLSRVLEVEAGELFPSRCPDETEWAVAAEGGLGRELTAHLDRCPRCRELWSYVRRAGSPGIPTSTGSRGSPGSWRLRQWAAVAALLVGVLLWARPWSPVPSASETIIRGPTVRLVASAEPAGNGDVVLSWDTAPGVERYRLRIWAEDGRLLLERELSGVVSRLDAATLERWDSTLLWQVEALRAGREVGGTSVQRLAWKVPTVSDEEPD